MSKRKRERRIELGYPVSLTYLAKSGMQNGQLLDGSTDGMTDSSSKFPKEWYYEDVIWDSALTSAGYRAFEPPDPAKLPEKILSDHGLFQRLLVTLRDLGHAKSACVFIDEMIAETQQYGQEEWRRICCYETTLVTSYARPFSQSRGGVPKLSFNALGVKISPYTEALHKRIIDARNQVFAHSDLEKMDFASPQILAHKGSIAGKRVTSIFPARFTEGLLLSEGDIVRASVLIGDLESAVFDQLQEMHTRFLDRYETV